MKQQQRTNNSQTLKGFKIDLDRADEVIQQTTPEQYKQTREKLTAKQAAQARRLILQK